MEFDWTTFALEIINFVVLVWILQRFLYRPVTNAIAERKSAIEKTMADANAVQAAAQSLKQQYENRTADWRQEQTRARAQLVEEIGAKRSRMMVALNASLEQERESARGREQRHAMELRHKLEEAAFAAGGQFAARLLSRVANPALEETIVQMLLEDLPRLADKDLQPLRAACRKGDTRIRITSGYPMEDEQRSHLIQALSSLAEQPVACDFVRDPDLLAGLRISIGPWILRSNLRDELKFFAEVHRAGQ